MKFGRNSYIGFGLIVIAIVLALLVSSLTAFIQEATAGSCGMEAEFCPHARNVPPELVLGYGIALVVALVGIYLIFTDLRKVKLGVEAKASWKKVIASLSDDEKDLYELVASKDGVMFQSALVEESGLQKVKVSRVLDRLEARNLIERRRRGMSNVIVLKSP